MPIVELLKPNVNVKTLSVEEPKKEGFNILRKMEEVFSESSPGSLRRLEISYASIALGGKPLASEAYLGAVLRSLSSWVDTPHIAALLEAHGVRPEISEKRIHKWQRDVWGTLEIDGPDEFAMQMTHLHILQRAPRLRGRNLRDLLSEIKGSDAYTKSWIFSLLKISGNEREIYDETWEKMQKMLNKLRRTGQWGGYFQMAVNMETIRPGTFTRLPTIQQVTPLPERRNF